MLGKSVVVLDKSMLLLLGKLLGKSVQERLRGLTPYDATFLLGKSVLLLLRKSAVLLGKSVVVLLGKLALVLLGKLVVLLGKSVVVGQVRAGNNCGD